MARIKFENQLSVIRVRKQYAAPYLKYKYMYLHRKDVKSVKAFIAAIKDIVKNWPDSIYYLKMSTGKVFVRFEVREGKIVKVNKTSPTTGKPYPIREFFKK